MFFAGAASLGVAAIGGLVAGVVASAVGSLILASFFSSRLAAIAVSIERIAKGDRYISFDSSKSGARNEFAGVADLIRSALVDADTASVDQARRETEAKLHHAGRAFYTRRFQTAVGDVVTAFNKAGERIRTTAEQLSDRNRHMADMVTGASEAAAIAAREAEGVADAARRMHELVLHSGAQVAASRAATGRTAAELSRADQAMSSLTETARRIGDVTKLIQGIAGQTSLLALNATIEAARAGEFGRGFAVVATEVKDLAKCTAQATAEIGAQISEIQMAVDATAQAIGSVGNSIAAMSEVNRNLNGLLDNQTSQLDVIGRDAIAVADTVGNALPGIRAVVTDVTLAGDAVLKTADDLLDRSQVLAESVGRYFADLDNGSIKVGILHSLSGTLTASERPLQQVIVMMIERLNAEGGLLGRPVEAVIMNPCSRDSAYAEQAKTLLVEHKVAAIFGCWTSASRQAVLPILKQHNGLLFYPSQYEGQEFSPQVFYLGGTPRQQALPAVDYLRGLGRTRFYLLGTDHVYPRTTNAILRNYLFANGTSAADVEECYTPFGEVAWDAIVERIKAFGAKGDAAVVATISGDANVHFFRTLKRHGVKAAHLPVMSLSIGEAELPALARDGMAGHFVGWNYLHGCDVRANREFIADWRHFVGRDDAITNDPMEASFIGFKLWANAVQAVGTTDPDAVAKAVAGSTVDAPSGFRVFMDRQNHHLHKPAMIGRITDQARIVPVWATEGLEPPEPESRWLERAERELFRAVV